MSRPTPTFATLDEWIVHESISFTIDSPASFNAAVDTVITALGDEVELLGFGEALHGGEDILHLRNRLFQRLVGTHGYSAIAIESSFPRARAVNDYVAEGGAASYDEIQECGFSHGFGQFAANRALVEWMRGYNADPSHSIKLRFYGFDSPTEMMFSDSPRQLLQFVLAYLAAFAPTVAEEHRRRIDPLLGDDAAWETTAAAMDPAQSIGLSPAATALRIETEELIAALRIRRPALTAQSDADRYAEAMHYAALTRQMLTYHAAVARPVSTRFTDLLGQRDAMMADNLAYIVSHEHNRGKVLAFAHNSHLQRGQSHWQLGPNLHTWWPAGAHLNAIFAARYAVIGTAVGVSEANGIVQPDPGTLEARLTAAPGPARFIPTHKGQGLPAAEIAALPVRAGSEKNSSYFALTSQSLGDFDWLAVMDATG